jgi:hypothetical protein
MTITAMDTTLDGRDSLQEFLLTPPPSAVASDIVFGDATVSARPDNINGERWQQPRSSAETSFFGGDALWAPFIDNTINDVQQQQQQQGIHPTASCSGSGSHVRTLACQTWSAVSSLVTGSIGTARTQERMSLDECFEVDYRYSDGPDYMPFSVAAAGDVSSSRFRDDDVVSGRQGWKRYCGAPSNMRAVALRIVAGLSVTGMVLLVAISKSAAATMNPQTRRYERTARCAQDLSPTSNFTDTTSPQRKALDRLFLFDTITVPTNKCTWDSEFGTMFSLLILWEAFHLFDGQDGSILEKTRTRLDDVCHWKYVHCGTIGTSAMKVQQLIFNNVKGLSGTIPTEVAGLVHLERLDLYTNPSLHGTLPTELGNMGRLKHLGVQHTSIGGSVPLEFDRLVNLQELWLDNTNLSGTMPPQVCSLQSGGDLGPIHCSCNRVICPKSCCKCKKKVVAPPLKKTIIVKRDDHN